MIVRSIAILLISSHLIGCGGPDEVEMAKIESLCFGWGAGNIAEIAVRKKYFVAVGDISAAYSESDFVREIQTEARKSGVDVPEKLILRIWRDSPLARTADDLRQNSPLVAHAMTLGRAACRDHYGLKYDKDRRR